jgi:hypothetical protein
MRTENSFFKREAIFTVVSQIVLPVLCFLLILFTYLWRYLSR